VKASFPGLMITISGLRDYLDVRVLEEDYPVGTEVTLHLKKYASLASKRFGISVIY